MIKAWHVALLATTLLFLWVKLLLAFPVVAGFLSVFFFITFLLFLFIDGSGLHNDINNWIEQRKKK